MTAKACETQFSSTLHRKCLHFHTRFSHKGSLSFVLWDIADSLQKVVSGSVSRQHQTETGPQQHG